MKQIPLPYTEEYTAIPEVMIGLTPWTNLATMKPPMVGWWKTRQLTSLGRPRPRTARRWWNGRFFSVAVDIDDDTVDAELYMKTPGIYSASLIEWCGLASRHPDRYPYRLFMRPSKESSDARPLQLRPVRQ